MLGIVIITHGDLSLGLKSAANVIFGTVNNVECLTLKAGDNVEKMGPLIEKAVKQVDQEKGVILFVDLVGASPYNQSLMVLNHLQNENYYVISGVNLPMVLEAMNQQLIGNTVEMAVDEILNQASNSVVSWSIKSISPDDDDDF